MTAQQNNKVDYFTRLLHIGHNLTITYMQWVFSENRRPAANQLHSLTHNIAAEP
jgi:hypothetical protein